MSIHVSANYRQFRKLGYSPMEAYRSAKTISKWELTELSTDHTIEIVAEPDSDCDIFDMDWEPENANDRELAHERKRIIELANRTGCWGVIGKLNGEEIDSVWGCWGYDNVTSPYENSYVVDIMRTVLDALAKKHETVTKQIAIADYELVNHGIEHHQYFQGCGTSFTEFDHVVTGCGDDFTEAYENALEDLAMSGYETDILDSAIRYDHEDLFQASGESVSALSANADEHEDYDSHHYYVSIRVR